LVDNYFLQNYKIRKYSTKIVAKSVLYKIFYKKIDSNFSTIFL